MCVKHKVMLSKFNLYNSVSRKVSSISIVASAQDLLVWECCHLHLTVISGTDTLELVKANC